MGLDLCAKGHEGLHISYGGFSAVREAIAIAADDMFDKDLALLLTHSDCEGALLPKECKRIYKKLKDIEPEFEIEDYHQEFYNAFRKMLKYCWKNDRIMHFF